MQTKDFIGSQWCLKLQSSSEESVCQWTVVEVPVLSQFKRLFVPAEARQKDRCVCLTAMYGEMLSCGWTWS